MSQVSSPGSNVLGIRVCPQCGLRYPGNAQSCTRDGSPLGPIEGSLGTAPPAIPERAKHPRTFTSGVFPVFSPQANTPPRPVIAVPLGAASGEAQIQHPTGSVLGSYQIESLIGQGGMGRVYRAQHVRLGRRVALKVLRKEFSSDRRAVQRFFREARAVNQINHENIVQITDFIERDESCFYVMEFLQGKTLADAMDDNEAFALARILGISLQICGALSAVHAAGIVHRDLKPENIFLSQRWGRSDLVKLLDFGIIKLLPQNEMSFVETVGGKAATRRAVMGTPEYMSPEQATGSEMDGRSDIYALGIIMYEMATGSAPFVGDDYTAVMTKHVHETPVPPIKVPGIASKIPKAFNDLIMQCLEKDPAQRPANGAQVLSRLGEIAISSGETVEGFAGPRREASPAGASRKEYLLLLISATAVIVAGLAVIFSVLR